jgi:hypothetical protein
MSVQAQTKLCMSYADFKAGQWKPYESITEDRKPDSCRVKYDGIEFSIKTDDKEPNAKGKIIMTRMNDQFMEKLLRDDPVTYEKYYGRGKKGTRQSAANILPILVKKGFIQDYHHPDKK